MKTRRLLLFFLPIGLIGCQSIGEHFTCISEVDRTIPAQTQQRYIRTDINCTSSSSGMASPTTTRGDQYVVNTDGRTNCTSTPIYETIVLNKAERDFAYQQCQMKIDSQKQADRNNQLIQDRNPCGVDKILHTYLGGSSCVTRAQYEKNIIESNCPYVRGPGGILQKKCN